VVLLVVVLSDSLALVSQEFTGNRVTLPKDRNLFLFMRTAARTFEAETVLQPVEPPALAIG